MRYVIVCLLLAGCSNVSFNKEINAEPSDFNKNGMQWDQTIQDRQFLDRRPYMEK